VARNTPRVSEGVLHFQGASGGSKIVVGSPSWIAWLTDPATRSFSFRSPSGAYTARKERRSRGGEYWAAYRRHSGRLRKAYLGKAEDLTLERLDEAARVLARSDDEIPVDPSPDTTVHQAGSAPIDAATTVGPASTNDPERGHPRQEIRGDPLLLTKLSLPAASTSLVPRSRLTARLEEGLRRKLTLVSAPAGFGKTTLLSASLNAPSSNGRPVAWLSLDPGDNDPVRFLRYFVATVDRVCPGVGTTALALLESLETPSVETILSTLVNELIIVPADVALVLDDYHLIESRAIHEALTFLLGHLPPRFHLVIATRADPPLPLARLRARGELNELRAADLRFTTEEAATFLDQVMELQLSAQDIAELETRTEGWIAGLQMAALAMRDRTDIPDFIAAFTGSNRFVVDYLAQEVLGRQPEVLRTFLLKTSVLDRMCGPLCDVVISGDNAQGILEHLEHDNLFVIPLDEERRWYRYHHLFTDVLRQHLRQTQADHVPELHRRASAWFEQQGLEAEAIRHALAAEDWERATYLIVRIAPPVAFSGQFHTALAWLDALPDASVRSNPTLCVYQAGALMFTNQVEAAEARLRDAERGVQEGVSEEQARIILGQVAAIRAAIARIYGDLALCVALGHLALELLPEPEVVPLRLRTVAALSVARSFLVSGDVTPDSERSVASVIAPLRTSGNGYAALLSTTNLARLQVLQGRLHQAASSYQEAMEMVSESGQIRGLVGGPTYYFGMGDLYRQWNDLEAAQRDLEQGMELVKGTLTVDADTIQLGYLSMARLQQALEEPNGALTTLEEFARLARQRNFFAPLLARGEAAKAWVRLAQGDLAGAVRWVQTSGLRTDDELNYPQEEEYLTLARILIAQGQEDLSEGPLDDALGMLARLLEAAENKGRMSSVIEILVLRALALQKRGDRSEALAALERALMLAEPEGYVRRFIDDGEPMVALLYEFLKARRKGPREAHHRALLDYARRLLAAFESRRPSTKPSTEPPLLAPLTTREREVLDLIASGLSNREIATKLFVEVSTVKSYANSIFRKLGVESRTQAVAEARALHLISD
jgi:LuxR family maltose regulon positive regulatory protein